MTGGVRVHRVRANHREWTPPQVMFFDTETTPELTGAGEVHTLRLWTARLVVRRTRTGTGTGESTGWGYTAAELADQVDIWAEGQRTLWVYAHNISFDLAVTRLPAVLHDRGWQVTGHAVASDSPWLRMRRGQCVLTFADSWGWLRAPLEQIGGDVGVAKPVLPGWDDSDGAWHERCAADTEILARAMCQLMDWWDAEHLGSWTLTGSAGGWNTWRHRTTCPLPLIVPGEEQTAADRSAIYGGRREAFRHGLLTGGPWILLDFESAYPSIAASMPLPSARQGNFSSLPVDSPLVCGDSFGIIATVTIACENPRYPVRVGGRVAYPVGKFVTVLAGPEIAEARRLGHLVSIGPGWLHRLSPHMAEWAQWVLDVTRADSVQVPAVARRAVKHWGRAVIGKTAAHGWRTIPLKSMGGDGWSYQPAWNARLGAPSHLTEVCGQASETIQHGDADNAYPAVLAWVESWVRVYLGQVMDRFTPGQVVSCDTDGLIVEASALELPLCTPVMAGPLRMREKARYKSVRIIGPQHVIAGGDRKLAGIPRSAVTLPDGTLEAYLWPRLSTQMQLRPGAETPAFVRPRQVYSLPETTITGWVRESGVVDPAEAAICCSGQTHLIVAAYGRPDLHPPELQASHMKSMITPLPEKGSQCMFHTSRSPGNTGGSSRSARTRFSAWFRKKTRRGAGKRR